MLFRPSDAGPERPRTLTPAGRRSLRTIERAQHVWAEELGAAVGLEPLGEAAAALERLVALLEERTGEPRGRAAGR